MGAIFADRAFVDLFSRRGRSAIAPAQLALVTVLQFAEGLSDMQAADAVRARIDWKYYSAAGIAQWFGTDRTPPTAVGTPLPRGEGKTLN